jgi:hypothetical protein
LPFFRGYALELLSRKWQDPRLSLLSMVQNREVAVKIEFEK